MKRICLFFFFLGAFLPRAFAQESVKLPEILVSGAEARDFSSDVTGFAETSSRRAPLALRSHSAGEMQKADVQRLSDLTRVDASITDSYDAPGYWDILSIRGYTLDNRRNYLREDLPINAETSLPLENKEKVDVLKGLAGLQAGVSAPGGVINYEVKRPTDQDLRALSLRWASRADLTAATDLGGRAGPGEHFGYRLNLLSEDIEPSLHDANGSRQLASLAGDWRLSADSLVAAELEWSRRAQPSQAGFSLLGNRLPALPDPNLNLNNQPWSQPVIFEGLTGTLRFRQNLNRDWRWALTAGGQNLRTDDRLAYPYGCGAEGSYDRYCSDGTFDFYDYRSENEKRDSQAAQLLLEGRFMTASLEHQLRVGALTHAEHDRAQPQAYNYVGTGNVVGTAVVPADPRPLDPGTLRDSTNEDLFASDKISWRRWSLWAGLRSSHLHLQSIRTDGSQPTDIHQDFLLPWAALGYQFSEMFVYLSRGDGTESFVTPNKNTYDHPGSSLRDVTSHQWEVGAKGSAWLDWQAAAFWIERPQVVDQAPTYAVDGIDRHRGVEGEISHSWSRWDTSLAAMLLEARLEEARLQPNLNGKKPVNVPDHTLRAELGYLPATVPGLRLSGRVVREGPRAVTADNGISLPAWTRYDLGVSYRVKHGEHDFLWRFSVENLSDHRYWRESPTQYGHVYLYPGVSRQWSLALVIR